MKTKECQEYVIAKKLIDIYGFTQTVESLAENINDWHIVESIRGEGLAVKIGTSWYWLAKNPL